MYSGVIEGPTTDRGFPYVGFSSNDTYSQHADSLQILSTYQWPEPEDEEDNREALMSHKKWGSGNVPREYAVEMSFIQNFFTLDFWDEVDRYGSSNFFPVSRVVSARTQPTSSNGTNTTRLTPPPGWRP